MNTARHSRTKVIAALGLTQIFGYGTSFYLLAVLGAPIAKENDWPLDWVIAGVSIGLLTGGLAAPIVGRTIERIGGRFVLAGGSLCFAAGLTTMGLATHIFAYWLAWCVVGLGMGAALYEAAFSALGRWYREDARSPITAVTLWGGFASTVCWPLTAFLNASVGWRWTCLIYAGVHLFGMLPLHYWLMPVDARAPAQSGGPKLISRGQDADHRTLFILLAASLMLTSMIVAIISVHLLSVLEQGGISAAAAVAIGALIGPSQVAGRVVEFASGRWLHPIWSALVAGALMALGIAILNVSFAWAAVAVVAYALGAGVSYIVRGTLPLALFGPTGYATLMGKLAFPSLIAQALAPWLASVVLARWGGGAVSAMLLAFSLGNVVLIASMSGARHIAVHRGDRS